MSREYYTISELNSHNNARQGEYKQSSLFNIKSERNLAFQFWGERYMATLYVLSQTVNFSNNEEKKSLQCYIQSMVDLVPSNAGAKLIEDFLANGNEARRSIEKNTRLIPEEMRGFSKSNLQGINDKNSLFIFTFLLNCYLAENLNGLAPNYSQLAEKWSLGNISKRDWGRAFWFVIHCSAKYPMIYNSTLNSSWILAYTAMIVCLKFLLPCPKCRAHLEKNLALLVLKNYTSTPASVFEWSWRLHNIVNEDEKKPHFPLSDAIREYTF